MVAGPLPRSRSALVALAGAVALAVAAVLPWLSTPAGSHAGVADAVLDGYVTFFAGVVVAVLVVGLAWNRIARAAAGVAGVAALGLVAYWLVQLDDPLQPAVGLLVTALAGLLLLGAAVYGEVEARADDRDGSEPVAVVTDPEEALRDEAPDASGDEPAPADDAP